MTILQTHREELLLLEDGILDQLEEYVYLASVGKPVPKNFHMLTALNILKRKRPDAWKEQSYGRPTDRKGNYSNQHQGFSEGVADILDRERRTPEQAVFDAPGKVEHEDERHAIIRLANKNGSNY